MISNHFVTWGVCGAIVLVPSVNRQVESLVHHGYAKFGDVEILIPLDHETATEQIVVEKKNPSFDLTDPFIGQVIGTHKVTSLQGPRKSPCPGCSKYHNGVDVGTTIGIPIYAPDAIEVVCKFDGNGGGYYAEFWYADMLWQLLHLKKDTCKSGGYEKGWKIAETGDTGNGTGPHLHLQLRAKDANGRLMFVKVKTGHLTAVLFQ